MVSVVAAVRVSARAAAGQDGGALAAALQRAPAVTEDAEGAAHHVPQLLGVPQ